MLAQEFASTPLFNDPNCIAYFKLESTADSKGSFTLTNNGSVAFNVAKFNNGADTGTVDQTTKWLGTSSNLGITGGPMSFSFWIKSGEAIPNTHIWQLISHDCNVNAVGTDIVYDNSSGTPVLQFRRIRRGIAVDGISYTYTLSTSVFHLLTLTYDGSTVTAYIDGASVGTVASSGNGSGGAGQPDGFGILDNRGGSSTHKTVGIIDDVPVFNRGLTATEVFNMYNGFPRGAALLNCFA